MSLLYYPFINILVYIPYSPSLFSSTSILSHSTNSLITLYTPNSQPNLSRTPSTPSMDSNTPCFLSLEFIYIYIYIYIHLITYILMWLPLWTSYSIIINLLILWCLTIINKSITTYTYIYTHIYISIYTAPSINFS